VINDGNHTYTYDAENRMITVDGSVQVYFYDAFGHQTQTIYGGNTYSRIFGLNGRAEVQFSGNTWMLSELYAGSVGGYLGNYSNNMTYFAHNDQVGTRRRYTDPNGNIVETCTSLPFGDALSCTGSTTGSPTAFTGQDWDPNTNLTRFPMRNYSTQQGRWMHPDPAGLAAADPSNPQSWNRYSYVNNSPTTSVDPLGLDDDGWGFQPSGPSDPFCAFGGDDFCYGGCDLITDPLCTGNTDGGGGWPGVGGHLWGRQYPGGNHGPWPGNETTGLPQLPTQPLSLSDLLSFLPCGSAVVQGFSAADTSSTASANPCFIALVALPAFDRGSPDSLTEKSAPSCFGGSVEACDSECSSEYSSCQLGEGISGKLCLLTGPVKLRHGTETCGSFGSDVCLHNKWWCMLGCKSMCLGPYPPTITPPPVDPPHH
jgi:RHS repeat-associated protein